MARYECKTAQNGFAAGKAFVLCVDHTIEYTQETPSEETVYYEDEPDVRDDFENDRPVKKHKRHIAGRILLVLLALFIAM